MADDRVSLKHLTAAVRHGEVRATDSAPADLDDDLAFAWRRIGTILNRERLTYSLESACAHLIPLPFRRQPAQRAGPLFDQLAAFILLNVVHKCNWRALAPAAGTGARRVT